MAEELKEVKPKATLDDVFDEEVITGAEVVVTETAATPTAAKKGRRRRKVVVILKCPLCEAGVSRVTYKDVYQLKKYVSVRGKIISTEKSGVCPSHQRQLAKSVKRARHMALLPYVALD